MSEPMVQVTLELPGTLVDLPERERNGLIRAGVYEATRARIRQLHAELTESELQVRRFENRYGMSLQRFEAEILPGLDSLQAHENYNDWFYWQSVLNEKTSLLASLRQVTPA